MASRLFGALLEQLKFGHTVQQGWDMITVFILATSDFHHLLSKKTITSDSLVMEQKEGKKLAENMKNTLNLVNSQILFL